FARLICRLVAIHRSGYIRKSRHIATSLVVGSASEVRKLQEYNVINYLVHYKKTNCSYVGLIFFAISFVIKQ
ncbi:MAG: hypothetical protein ABWZ79_01465, partial [Pedobacter agri]